MGHGDVTIVVHGDVTLVKKNARTKTDSYSTNISPQSMKQSLCDHVPLGIVLL